MRKVDTNGLKAMRQTEGLVLQGCGGDLQEWADGINGLLKEEGILIGDSKFQEVIVFEHEGLTNLLFPFDDVRIDAGRLAMWRLRTSSQFGSTCLSEYVENRLGGFLDSAPKPNSPLVGTNGNIFSLMAVASRTLEEHGQDELAKQMVERITKGDCHSYEDALNIIGEYVNITSANEQIEKESEEENEMDMGVNEVTARGEEKEKEEPHSLGMRM